MTANMIDRNSLGIKDAEDDMNPIIFEEMLEMSELTDWDKESAIF